VALVWVFLHTLAAYYAFYHLGTPGTGWGLLYIVMPATLVIASVVGLWILRRLLRQGASRLRAYWASTGTIFLVLSVLLGLVIGSTTAERSGEGPGAGNLIPYVLYHFR
jgi:hypothetical protein